LKKSFLLDDMTMEGINEFDISVVREKLRGEGTVEGKIERLEEMFLKINDLIFEISTDIEDLFIEEKGNDENTKLYLSIANYKQLVLRNYRYVILEEMIIWKNELILELRTKIEQK